jgi:hypothetical protein
MAVPRAVCWSMAAGATIIQCRGWCGEFEGV